jgi:hypothetical protein
VKKLAVLGAGVLAAGSVALISAAVATSQPNPGGGSLNVTGEPYGKALQILKSQNVKAFFGGAHGSDLPQSECIVSQQRITSGGRMYLTLDCTEEAAVAAGTLGGADGGPTVGSNGVTTVTPTPVVPIPGAPGAGTPPPPA